jgi:hypothetical protein
MARSVADPFVATLAAAGVKGIYGIVGDSLSTSHEDLRLMTPPLLIARQRVARKQKRLSAIRYCLELITWASLLRYALPQHQSTVTG